YKKALGPEHPDTAALFDNLASVLQDQGDFAGARPLRERALAVREKTLGPEHLHTADSRQTSAPCSRFQAAFQGHSRCTSAPGRCGRGRSPLTIPIRQLP